ncbi:MAG: universal stress protein [Rhodospirillaceae bacterium]|jgi:nucleotide-binding universal stress UspA family protein|nr:universal stress protein [Rhodospirillaceae bacterium]MBT6116812.1 universal stress protein [Rhodospirillaceae bacterium]
MYKTILLAVDLTAESSWRKALPVAIAQCEAFGARLHILNVVPDVSDLMVSQYFPHGYEDKIVAEATKELTAFATTHVPAAVPTETDVAHGTIYEEIIQAADRVDADLIVMAAHRPELSDYLLGPNASRVIRHCSRSVLVVRE